MGLISFGALEDKAPLILSPLILPADVTLVLYKNYDYPKIHVNDFLKTVLSVLHEKELTGLVFDLRVRGWLNVQHMMRVRNLSQSLQNICDSIKVNSSVFLSNDHQPMGSAIGANVELLEAADVLKGEGPPDLTKFILEIGTDLLLLAKKFQQKSEAKKFLKDKILEGKAVAALKRLNKDFLPILSEKEKMRILSSQKGYVCQISMETLARIKSQLISYSPRNGFTLHKKIGDRIEKGDPLVEVFLNKGQYTHPLKLDILKAFVITSYPPDFQPLILEKPEIRILS